MGKIIFVRHGETDFNKNKLYFGRLNPPLNENGRKQVEETVEKIKKINYDNIYSSPLLRTSQSANILNYLNKDIKFDDRLMELDFGVVEGMTLKEIEKKYPYFLNEMNNNWLNFNYLNGESPNQMFERVIDFLKTLDYSKNNLIVAHWGTINSAISYFLTGDMSLYWKINTRHASIIELKGDKDFMFLSSLY